MRRVVLLALLALALPTAALADAIDYSANAKNGPVVVSGTVAAGNTVTVSFSDLYIDGVLQTNGAIDFTINVGSSCGTACFTIGSGSTVTVWNNGSAIYTSTLTAPFAGDVITYNGSILDVTAVISGGSTGITLSLSTGPCDVSEGSSCWKGSTDVVTTVPEPGSLGLLGTGLIGLAGLVRRKIRG